MNTFSSTFLCIKFEFGIGGQLSDGATVKCVCLNRDDVKIHYNMRLE